LHSFEDYKKSAELIRERANGFEPELLMILGSGLGFLGDRGKDPCRIEYTEIPGFRVSTAPGHAGALVLGELGGKRVCVMQGRVHYYEGYSMEDIAFPVRTARLLGAKTLLVTNAAGGVNESFSVGDIMLITDHIKLFDESPLRGPNIGGFGPRFNDMTHTYTAALREKALDAAARLGMELRQGVYMYFPGPQYETPAEIRAARILGADAVGMSTVPEVIAARHCGMDILGFSLISNLAAGITDEPLSEEEVLIAAEAAKDRFSALVLECLESI
jgi:purine-nucleoside phosphorylase